MSDLMPAYRGNDTAASKIPFFKKPGSVTGTVFLGIGGLLLLWKINPILEFLNSLLANTVTTVGLVIVLAAMAYVICDKKMRTIVSELYFMLVRKLMNVVVDMDPISIVRHHIDKLNKKIAKIKEDMGSLRGFIIESEKRYEKKKTELEDDILRAKKYRELGQLQEAQVCDNSIQRKANTLRRLEEYITESKKWWDILDDIKHTAELTVKDKENEVEERVEEWELIRKQHQVFSSVMSIIKGDDSDEIRMFTMAMENMSYEITQKLGDMENIINETNSITKRANIDKMVVSEKATALLERYDQFGIEGIIHMNDKERMALGNKNNGRVEYVNATPYGSSNTAKPKTSWFES